MERTSFLQTDEKRKKNTEEEKGLGRGRQGAGKKTEEPSVETDRSKQLTVSENYLFRAFYNKGGGHHHLHLSQRQAALQWKKREFRCALIRGCGHEEAASSLTWREVSCESFGGIFSFPQLVLRYSWGSNTLDTFCEELTHWKRPWFWERLKVGEEGDDRRWVGWMASPTLWTWAWASSGSWWWTGRCGVLQSMGLQRVRHDWVTELNWSYNWEQNFGNLVVIDQVVTLWDWRLQELLFGSCDGWCRWWIDFLVQML